MEAIDGGRVAIPLVEVGGSAVGVGETGVRRLVVELEVGTRQVDGVGVGFLVVDGVDGQHKALARLHGHRRAIARNHIDGIGGEGFVHHIGRVVALRGGQEFRLEHGDAVGVERHVGVVRDDDIGITTAVLIALGRGRAREENLADDETTLGLEGIDGEFQGIDGFRQGNAVGNHLEIGFSGHAVLQERDVALGGDVVGTCLQLGNRNHIVVARLDRHRQSRHPTRLHVGSRAFKAVQHHVADVDGHFERQTAVFHDYGVVVAAARNERNTHCEEHH